MCLISHALRIGVLLAAAIPRMHAYAKVGLFKLKTHDLSHLRTLEQALVDLIAKRDKCADPSNKRAQLDRMIRDLQTEIAARKGDGRT